MTQFRRDPVSGRWVIIAAERSRRPRQLNAIGEPNESRCPFCAGHETDTPPAVLLHGRNGPTDSERDWQVRVVPNKYPALTEFPSNQAATSLQESKTGVGVHEVIIEHPQHVTDVCELSAEEFLRLFKVYRQRIAALSSDPRWRAIILYKNQGERAGATLEHVHTQLIALPTIPVEIENELSTSIESQRVKNGCVACAMLSQELRGGQRIVAQNDRYSACCPFAPRFAYETWIWPLSHQSAFAETTDEELISLAAILCNLLRSMAAQLNHPAFNFVLHTAPLPVESHKEYHWHIEIMPRLNQAAGFEWGSGLFINPVGPEDAASLLRFKC